MADSNAPVFPYPGGAAGAEPPDPQIGKPGHFAWSRWIKQFVKNLNAGLMAHEDKTSNVHGILNTAALVLTTDPRLSDARPPTAHATSHAAAGSDPVTVAESQVTGLTAALAAKVPASLFDANTILAATTDNTPSALVVPASTLVGRAVTGGIAALTPAVARALLSVVDLSTLGNRLSAAQATPSTGAYTLYGCTESGALVLTATGAGGLSASVVNMPVTAGVVYTVRADLACVGRSAAVRISWRNSGGAEISAVAGDTIAAGTSGESMATGLAPSGAVTMTACATYSATGAGADTVTVTRAGVWVGAGGLWVPPGIAVPDLGIRTTRPNVDDVWVRAWSGPSGDPSLAGRWQTVRYDSGWRDVTPATAPSGWAAVPAVLIRRMDEAVYVTGGATASAVTSGWVAIVELPVGFRAPTNVEWIARSGWTAAGICVVGSYSDSLSALGPTPDQPTYLSGTFSAAPGLPTSLPGTLVSAAPAA